MRLLWLRQGGETGRRDREKRQEVGGGETGRRYREERQAGGGGEIGRRDREVRQAGGGGGATGREWRRDREGEEERQGRGVGETGKGRRRNREEVEERQGGVEKERADDMQHVHRCLNIPPAVKLEVTLITHVTAGRMGDDQRVHRTHFSFTAVSQVT